MHKDQRVKWSAEWLAVMGDDLHGRQKVRNSQAVGTVKGFGRQNDVYMIRWDHKKASEGILEKFLEPV